jgi:hypothetical protein
MGETTRILVTKEVKRSLDFEVRLHPDRVNFLLDLDQDTKERIILVLRVCPY